MLSILQRTFLALLALGLCVLPAAAAPSEPSPEPSIVPAPASLTLQRGHFTLSKATAIFAAPSDKGAVRAAANLAGLLKRTRGLDLKVGVPASANTIRFLRDPSVTGDEAYVLDVTAHGVVVRASGDGGLFYGGVTVWQLATQGPGQGAVDLPALHIADAPRFAWRGLMLDSARHFQSVAYIERFIDQMAAHKLNVLHWHLTDDQAWRLEIRKYPRLTGAASCRVPAGAGPAADIDPKTKKPRQYCGFYTQADVRRVVAYAAARNITVVPEIDMPGHAQAAVVAYPKLSAALKPPTAIRADWGVFPHLYNVDDDTFRFIDDVMGEVVQLFPSRFIHVGGDEAVKDEWKASPAVQARMKALGIADEHAMQGWFTSRLEKILEARGRRLIGWDEILVGEMKPDSTVMSWRGIEGAVAAAKRGHDTVLAPWPLLYLDNRQSPSADEPPGRGRVVTLQDIYAFDPAPAELTADERKHVIGVQGNAWTEHMRTEERLSRMVWPRAAALSEVAWTPEDRRGWPGFVGRLPGELYRITALGMPVDTPAFEPQMIADATDGGARVTLSTTLGLGDIRYAVGPKGPLKSYGAPLDLKGPATLRARTYLEGRPLGAEKRWTIDARSLATRNSHELALCTDKLVLSLEDDAPVRGRRAVFLIDVMDPCWLWKDADLTGVTRLEVAVGQVPFNFQIGDDVNKITFHPPATAAGELEVRLDGCAGERIASIPLAPAADNPGVTVLTGQIAPRAGRHDLCLTFAQKGVDPMWAVDRITLDRPPPPSRK